MKRVEPCKSLNLRDYITRTEICKRSHALLRKNLEKAIACYKRDLPFTNLFDIINRMKTDISTYVFEFEQTLDSAFVDSIFNDFNSSFSPLDSHSDSASSDPLVEQKELISSPH